MISENECLINVDNNPLVPMKGREGRQSMFQPSCSLAQIRTDASEWSVEVGGSGCVNQTCSICNRCKRKKRKRDSHILSKSFSVRVVTDDEVVTGQRYSSTTKEQKNVQKPPNKIEPERQQEQSCWWTRNRAIKTVVTISTLGIALIVVWVRNKKRLAAVTDQQAIR
jgi:hypothetical protein